MNIKWPSFTRSKVLDRDLAFQIKQLQDKLDDSDFDQELRELESKSFSTADSSSSLSGLYGVVDEYYDKAMLQRLYTTETWFFISVHTLAKSIAALPIKLEKRKKVTQSVAQSDGTSDKIDKEIWIDASAEPEYDILTKPNCIQSSIEFWMLVIIDLMATGDAYIFMDKGELEADELADNRTPEGRLREVMNRTRKANVRAMYRLSSGLVRPQPSEQNNKILGGYQINTEAGIFNFDADEVLHIRLPNPCDPFYGLSPIIPVMKNLLIDKYSAEHMIRFYKQGARLGGVIKTGKKLTKDQLIRLERVFESNFTGKRNHHKTLILPEGMEYDTIEQNPGETSLIEFMQANKEPILAAYNMPPIKVGLLDGATYSNALIQDKTYYNDTIKPICRLIEEAINQQGVLLPKVRELKFTFSFDEIEALKEDQVAKSTSAKGMLDAGMSINEVREKVWKLGPVDGGDMIPALEKNKAPAPNPMMQLNAHPTDVKAEVANVQNDTAAISDIKPTDVTFETRVAELVAASIQSGIAPAVAVPQAISQAMVEGFTPTPAAEKKTPVSPTTTTFTKEFLTAYQKDTTGTGVDHLIEERLSETNAFFDRMEKFFIKKLKKNNKSLRTKAGDVFDEDDMTEFLGDEFERMYDADLKAMRHGYKQSIQSRPMTFPNERAQKILQENSAKKIKYITETTRKRINGIISDSFGEQQAVGEIASRIRDVFPEIKAGRGMTIARTETLSAVSLGQNLKAQEFRAANPTEAAKMKKMWITAQDDRVRDSHVELDGVSVELDSKFANGLFFPRDPEGEAGEVINCRCTTIEYLPEDQDEIEATMANGSPLAAAADAADDAETEE